MFFGIKKINVFLICVMVALTLLTGCSAGTPNADRIKNDLNASDIVGSKEFFGKSDAQMIPVTKVSIVDKTVEDDECEIKCNVVLEDDNGNLTAVVVNTAQNPQYFNLKFNSSLNNLVLRRHMFEYTSSNPTEEAKLAGVDKIIRVNNEIKDVVPAGGVMIYTTRKD